MAPAVSSESPRPLAKAKTEIRNDEEAEKPKPTEDVDPKLAKKGTMVEAVPTGVLSFKERLAKLEALNVGGSGRKMQVSKEPPAPVKIDKPAEQRGEQLSMKERLAQLEKIAQEKRKKEQQAIAERKAN